jgi:hypothetical protein
MEQSRRAEIVSVLSRYLAGEETLADFQDWLAPLAWESDALDADAAELVDSVQLRVAEFTSGHLTEDELREELRTILRGQQRPVLHRSVGSANSAPRYTSSATTTWVAHAYGSPTWAVTNVTIQPSGADTKSAAASA